MGVKDSLGESKKFVFLALALLFVCVLIIFAMKSGLYNSTGSLIGGKNTYEKAEYILEDKYDYTIVITTIYGDIKIDLYENMAPENVNSILFLIGERYYEGLTFHKVIKNFVLQAGDVKGDGTGDPGYSVKKENLVDFEDYTVGMANASQFFIVLPNSSKSSFNGQYSVIGKVTEGFVVLDSIQKVEVDTDYRPINDVVIKSIQIHEN
jgi:cyclophilin family peptidyl-prolyl cis-trans isomerase